MPTDGITEVLSSIFLQQRRGNPKELTLEAVGLVDSQKTGMHYNELWFDDAIEKTCAGSVAGSVGGSVMDLVDEAV